MRVIWTLVEPDEKRATTFFGGTVAENMALIQQVLKIGDPRHIETIPTAAEVFQYYTFDAKDDAHLVRPIGMALGETFPLVEKGMQNILQAFVVVSNDKKRAAVVFFFEEAEKYDFDSPREPRPAPQVTASGSTPGVALCVLLTTIHTLATVSEDGKRKEFAPYWVELKGQYFWEGYDAVTHPIENKMG